MNLAEIVQVLENAVYSHSRYIDRCRILIKKASQGETTKILEGFSRLSKTSKRLEKILVRLSNAIEKGAIPLKDPQTETVSAIVFYVYEVAVEEERDLWNRFAKLISSEGLSEHYSRLEHIKVLAQRALEIFEEHA
uniref:Uncharacterized protein n=1 Tax=Ignisphaera aggregans TaxID=334771 RepID=A0A7C2V9I9_9CREN